VSTCGRCHRTRSCPDCGADLRVPIFCHRLLSAHLANECVGDRRPALVAAGSYRAEDYITTGAPRVAPGERRKYHWENFVGAGWQERIPGKDYIVATAAFRTAGTNYARSHGLYFRWEMRGDLFAFELSKEPFSARRVG
jgi:hypothetical protein